MPFFLSETRLAGPGQAYGQLDELVGEGFEPLPIGDGGLKLRSLLRRDTTAGVGPVLPNLMFEVRTHRGPRSALAIFGLEAPQLHGVEGGHLADEFCSAFNDLVAHGPNLSRS